MWVVEYCMRQCTVKTSRAVLDLEESICFQQGALHHRQLYVLVWSVFTLSLNLLYPLQEGQVLATVYP